MYVCSQAQCLFQKYSQIKVSQNTQTPIFTDLLPALNLAVIAVKLQ